MRRRGVTDQTNWSYPPIFRAGSTGGASGSTIPSGVSYPPAGMIVVGATTTTTTILDLTSISGPATKSTVQQGLDDWSPNPTGHRIMVQPDGDDIIVALADAPATLGALSATITTAIDGGTISGATGKAASTYTSSGGTTAGMRLKNGVVYGPWDIPVGVAPPGIPTLTSGGGPIQDNDALGGGRYSPARYLGFVAGATSAGVYLRIWPASD